MDDSSYVVVNGQRIVGGKNINITAGRIVVDGVDVTPDGKTVNIEVHGNVTSLTADYAKTIQVSGDVGALKTGSGDVQVRGVTGGVETGSGDITCAAVGGNVRTGSGDVECDAVAGSVQTGSGHIRHRK